MKVLSGSIILVFSGLVVCGQQARTTTPPTPPSMPVAAARVLTEISATSDKIVKGAPFSAEGVSESVQTLADGNRIVRSWSEKLYRSSDGRFRRESTGGNGTAFGSVVVAGTGVTILDPVGGARYTFNSDDKTARAYTLRSLAPVIVSGQAKGEPILLNGQGSTIATTVDGDKIRAEIDAVKAAQAAAGVKAISGVAMTAPVALAMPSTNGQKWETRTEQLGVQNFEGVDAEGTRTITTIPADAIGNERPIEIVYERWYSKELQMIVYSKHSDPRFGEQTYRLTNINRSEPDPSLFQVPNSYRIVNEPSPFNRTSVNQRATVERVSTSKSAQASRP
jgi:hypothetical protein